MKSSKDTVTTGLNRDEHTQWGSILLMITLKMSKALGVSDMLLLCVFPSS